jgi:hypothetical protein
VCVRRSWRSRRSAGPSAARTSAGRPARGCAPTSSSGVVVEERAGSLSAHHLYREGAPGREAPLPVSAPPRLGRRVDDLQLQPGQRSRRSRRCGPLRRLVPSCRGIGRGWVALARGPRTVDHRLPSRRGGAPESARRCGDLLQASAAALERDAPAGYVCGSHADAIADGAGTSAPADIVECEFRPVCLICALRTIRLALAWTASSRGPPPASHLLVGCRRPRRRRGLPRACGRYVGGLGDVRDPHAAARWPLFRAHLSATGRRTAAGAWAGRGVVSGALTTRCAALRRKRGAG